MSNGIYDVVHPPDFKGELVTSTIEYPKNRASIQSDALEVIARRNRFYLLHAVKGGSPFVYDRNTIYLDDKVVAVLNNVKDTEQGKKERNLVRLANPKIVLDLTKINSELCSIAVEVGGKQFRIAFPYFDWILYRREKVGNIAERDMMRWAASHDYLDMEIDKSGRVVTTEFKQQLGLEGTFGYRGFGGALIIANPEYLGSEFLHRVPEPGSREPFKVQDNRMADKTVPQNVKRRDSKRHPRGSGVHPRIIACHTL